MNLSINVGTVGNERQKELQASVNFEPKQCRMVNVLVATMERAMDSIADREVVNREIENCQTHANDTE